MEILMSSVQANEMIKATKVRLVTDTGSEVVSIQTARKEAEDKGLDLIQINEADVPVVKIVDMNKYLYEIRQAEKENKKKQRQSVVQVKELQFAMETQQNDLNVKAKNAKKFISEGKQVKFLLKMPRRRSVSVQDMCIEKMKVFASTFTDISFVQDIQVQGNDVVCVIKKA